MVNPSEFLKQRSHITIAVVDASGRPWAVTVKLQKYKNGTVEWFSKTDSVHSQAIAINGEIAVSAFTTKANPEGEYGIFTHAKAQKALAIPGGVALYKAKIYEAWYNDENHIKTKIDIKEL